MIARIDRGEVKIKSRSSQVTQVIGPGTPVVGSGAGLAMVSAPTFPVHLSSSASSPHLHGACNQH